MAAVSLSIPLYIYPDPHCWDALFDTLSKHRRTHFNIIINPFNGPGGAVPDSNYIREVARLNDFRNATIFGYIHVSWGNRALKLVLEDIAVWTKWRDYAEADIHVSGIFIDEAPSDLTTVDYMNSVYKQVKTSLGRSALVWTNPGVQVDKAFYSYADLVNCYENAYVVWKEQEPSHETHPKATTIVHSHTGSREEYIEDVSELRQQGYRSILVTTETCFTSFTQHMDELASKLSS